MIVYSINNTSSKNKKLFIVTCDITLLIHVVNKKILNIIVLSYLNHYFNYSDLIFVSVFSVLVTEINSE